MKKIIFRYVNSAFSQQCCLKYSFKLATIARKYARKYTHTDRCSPAHTDYSYAELVIFSL